MAKFYITTAIPYVNAKPHVGHALEFVHADVLRRYQKIKNRQTLLLSGGDENALKNVQAAQVAGINVKEFVDKNSALFAMLAKKLNIEFDVFQKGGQDDHHRSSQKLWELCSNNNDIYQKEYAGLYCIGCEQFYEQEELNENGECIEHPGKKLEEVKEKNYFFKLSRYQKQIEEMIKNNDLIIIPEFRKKEVLNFIQRGLKDISISRSNERAKNWGVPVPGDDSQRMYVWFDALNIYQSGIGFGIDEEKYKKWWPADIHVIGKGIIRFHAIYWPAFLLSAGLKLPKALYVHGYFTVDGQKMSKTIGNVIDPLELIEKYSADVLRYYFLREIPSTADGDFSERRLLEIYNSDLANGLGNLIARVAKLCETIDYQQMESKNEISEHVIEDGEYAKALEEYRLNEAIGFIWKKTTALDQYINQEKPWTLIKTNSQKVNSILAHCVDQIQEIALLLRPFMPQTAETILTQFKGPKIVSDKPLFPRIQ